jgi:hypothetical protein
LTSEECATLCSLATHLTNSHMQGCHSFDYHYLNGSCRLSVNSLRNVGGLVHYTEYDNNIDGSSNVSIPVYHFERRLLDEDAKSLTGTSRLVIKGRCDFINDFSALSKGINFGLDVEITNKDTVHIGPAMNLYFQRGLYLGPTTMLNIYANGEIYFKGVRSSLNLAASAGIYSLGGIIFSGGEHVVHGKIHPNSVLKIENNAKLTVFTNVSKSDCAYFNLNQLLVSNNSQLTFSDFCTSIITPNLQLLQGSRIQARFINITSTQVTIDKNSTLTVDGGGYVVASGPGAGSGHYLGGSGAAYGGRGSVAKVDSLAEPYGNILYPLLAGSGGGFGYHDNLDNSIGLGGEGGGVIFIKSATVSLDGNVTADGVSGQDGRGGGSGGSILIIATTSFFGQGLVSARGGDGGFAGKDELSFSFLVHKNDSFYF